MSTPRIFVSHSHTDNEFGARLAQDLRRVLQNERAVFYDSLGGLHGGDTWWDKIIEEVTACDVFLLILSPQANTSLWVKRELNMAINENKHIVPLLYQDCIIRADLKTIQFVSFLAPKTYEAAFQEVLTALGLPSKAAVEAQARNAREYQAQTVEQAPPFRTQLASSQSDRVGEQWGNYRLTRFLGQGSRGAVYLGVHIHLQSQAAIKVLLTVNSSADMEHFRDETRMLARLTHPNIVRVLDFGVEGKTPFIVMEYAPNGNLRQRHPQGEILPFPTIISYARHIALALQYAHDQRLIHQDVKPENILVGRTNEVLLSDFGTFLQSSSSGYNNVYNAIVYMAPEQIMSSPLPASDQYALAVMVYEWLCGFPPFMGTYSEIIAQQIHSSPPPLHEKVPTIPSAVEQVILKALNKDPQQRFASIREFANALDDAGTPFWRS